MTHPGRPNISDNAYVPPTAPADIGPRSYLMSALWPMISGLAIAIVEQITSQEGR
jgi:hypothetical protein